jgi:thiol-disulfide isomerase/thioredoxin
MKSLLICYYFLCLLLFISSCGKDNSTNDMVKPLPGNELSLTVYLSKSQIAANGLEETTFTVKDQANVDVTSSSVIYVNDQVLAKNAFSTTTPGSYRVKAVKGTLSSPIVNLIAANQTTSVFTQRVLAEFFTGTWCGICPGTLIPLENYTKTNPNIIMIGIHGPNGSNDPFQFIYDSQLRATFGVSGVPTVLINRNSNWNGSNVSLDQLAKNAAQLGIGIETSVTGNIVAAKVKVKFGEAINAPLKIVVMLVEDGILYDQTNYGHFNLPNPIPGFAHRNVLRSTATDIFGDAVPAAQQTKDNIWQKDYTIDASKYVASRCRVVAFVLYGANSSGLKGVLNSQIVNAGQSINF